MQTFVRDWVWLSWLGVDLSEGDQLMEVTTCQLPSAEGPNELTAAYAAIRHADGRWTIVHRMRTAIKDARDVLVVTDHDAPLACWTIRDMMAMSPRAVIEVHDASRSRPLDSGMARAFDVTVSWDSVQRAKRCPVQPGSHLVCHGRGGISCRHRRARRPQDLVH